MLDNKTRSEILLEEKVAKIDDINFDKIYDVEEFASRQLETFEDETPIEISNNRIEQVDDDIEVSEAENKTAFELELQPNEFLDNLVWGEEDEIEEIHAKKSKFILQHKPLFFAITSIAFLLCILFIYNVFVIKSLESSASSAGASSSGANISNSQELEHNNIVLNGGTQLEIDNKTNYITKHNKQNNKNTQTNWFNELCIRLNQLFGGNY